MPRFPLYKYEFELGDQKFLLAVGQSVTSNEGAVIRVHKFERTNRMNRLWISLDGGNWTDLEQGYRTEAHDQFRNDFKKFKMSYPDCKGNVEHKSEEVIYQ